MAIEYVHETCRDRTLSPPFAVAEPALCIESYTFNLLENISFFLKSETSLTLSQWGRHAMDQLNVLAWEGRTDTDTGAIQMDGARRISAALGCNPKDLENGASLPPLWHWCAFPPVASQEDLCCDGHPRSNGFLPPLRLDRRMWARGALRFYALLRIGDPITRRSAIRSVTQKRTRWCL